MPTTIVFDCGTEIETYVDLVNMAVTKHAEKCTHEGCLADCAEWLAGSGA